MVDPNQDCQTPSREAPRTGASGIDPPPFGESVFVADVADGVLDVEHFVTAADPVLDLCVQITRCVGTVDSDGFLRAPAQKVLDGTLVDRMVLSIRAMIGAPDAGGLLGWDGLDVDVVFHRGTNREISVGSLTGSFLSRWQTYEIDVPVECLRFPADPCPGLPPDQSCGVGAVPQPNPVSLVFSGFALPVRVTVDWIALTPVTGTQLATRPILLVHGWEGTPGSWDGSAWTTRLPAMDIPHHVMLLPPYGTIAEDAPRITGAVHELAERFGVDRVNIVAHSNGGVAAREHVRAHDDVETLVMIGTPNLGTVLALPGMARGVYYSGEPAGARAAYEITPVMMTYYDLTTTANPRTTYVTVAGSFDSWWSLALLPFGGPNDEVIPVASVEAVGVGTHLEYATSVNDPITAVCTAQGRRNHSCLLVRDDIFQDVFDGWFRVPSPAPVPPPGQLARAAEPGAGPPSADQGQVLACTAGSVATGVTDVVPIVLDSQSAVAFLVQGEPADLGMVVVGPSGERIDADAIPANPSGTDPAVASVPGLGELSFAGVVLADPAPGGWAVEVTGRADPAAGGAPYAVCAIAPHTPGVGVELAVAVDPAVGGAGTTVAVAVTLTGGGAPVTDATVTAVVTPPGATASIEVPLTTGADGVRTGVVADTAAVGLYTVTVTASGTAPAFSRIQVAPFTLTAGGAAFTGTVTDAGLDTTGDALFDLLVVDVGVQAVAPADHRLLATLVHEASGALLERAATTTTIAPGSPPVRLEFDGAGLADRGLDGPYLVTDLLLEDVAAGLVVAVAEDHRTAAYPHTAFQRPACMLTGVTGDHGVNLPDTPLRPFEQLVVEVEVDLVAPAQLEATARLQTQDGTLLDVPAVQAAVPAGLSVLAFTTHATSIFRGGRPGPYTLQALTITGTTQAVGGAPALPVSLVVPGVVAVTATYALEDFAPTPRYTVSGTVTGLLGVGLLLRLTTGTGSTADLRRFADGPFTFAFPSLPAGISYDVRVITAPVSPVQICTVSGGAGTMGDQNVTDVQVVCR